MENIKEFNVMDIIKKQTDHPANAETLKKDLKEYEKDTKTRLKIDLYNFFDEHHEKVLLEYGMNFMQLDRIKTTYQKITMRQSVIKQIAGNNSNNCDYLEGVFDQILNKVNKKWKNHIAAVGESWQKIEPLTSDDFNLDQIEWEKPADYKSYQNEKRLFWVLIAIPLVLFFGYQLLKYSIITAIAIIVGGIWFISYLAK